MTIDPRTKFIASRSVHAKRFERELVLLDLAGGRYYGLDEVGAEAWQLIAGGATVGETADALLARYDITRERLESDIRELLEALLSRRLVEIAP